jgi:protein-tyrosine phosphatase
MADAPSRVGVLFVCHANICRSPLAHAVCVHRAERRGFLDRLEIDSAGTWAADGILPHTNSIAVGRAHGIDLAVAGTSRIIKPDDLQRFDHVIAMDRDNEMDILRLQRLSAFGSALGPQARVRLLRRVAKPNVQGGDADVPDPIGRGPEAFQRTYEIINAGVEALLDEIERRLQATRA